MTTAAGATCGASSTLRRRSRRTTARLVSADAASHRLSRRGVRRLARSADLIGFHGQTILHQPHRRPHLADRRRATLARRSGCAGRPRFPVGRRRRGRAGGAARAGLPCRTGGGSAQATGGAEHRRRRERHLDRERTARCSPSIPGRAMARSTTGCRAIPARPSTGTARWPRSGRADADVLARLIAHPYFGLPGPKSLDRLDFGKALAESGLSALSAADGAATLAAIHRRRDRGGADFPNRRDTGWFAAEGGSIRS